VYIFASRKPLDCNEKQNLTWPLVVRLILGDRLCVFIECGGRLEVRADAARVGPVLGIVPLLRALDPTRVVQRHGLVHGHLLAGVLRQKGVGLREIRTNTQADSEVSRTGISNLEAIALEDWSIERLLA
jgi:hypothetical protein